MEHSLHYNLLAAHTLFQKRFLARLRQEYPALLPGQPKVIDYLMSHPDSFQREIADGCLIEGEVTDSIIFRGCHIAKGAKVTKSIIMQDSVIGAGAQLSNIISDKDVTVGAGVTLAGSPKLPLVVPKGSVL